MEQTPIKAPWLKFYNGVPEHLEYPDKSMYEMLQLTVSKNPEYNCFEFFGKKTTYMQMLQRTDIYARAFKALGVNKGDSVTICLPNCPQAVECFYAINKIGAIANMVHPLSAPKEIAFFLNNAGSGFIVMLDAFYGKLKSIRDELEKPVLAVVAAVQDELPLLTGIGYTLTQKKKPELDSLCVRWKDFVAGADNVPESGPEPADNAATAAILYSGGTTGTTKGIKLSSNNFNALGMQTYAASGYYYLKDPKGLKMLAVMPVFHGFGLGVCIHMSMIFGLCCILVPQFSMKTYTGVLKKKKPSFIVGVPTIYEALLRNKDLDGVDLSYLMGVFCGGDSLSPELKHRVDKFLKEHNSPVPVREGYGTTECVTASCLTPADAYREGSIGIPFPDTYYKITAVGTTEELPYGQEGEICICGKSVMIGYNHNDAETASALRVHPDGHTWLHTGDLGTMDSDGFVYFRQRIKRMIISSGYNIYPSQLEGIIDAHPAVHMSCVIGVKDAYKMQRVKAFIMLKPGYMPSDKLKEELLEYCKEHIAKYAMPREIEFRESLPTTLVGKVAYRKLEEEEPQG